MVVAQIAQRFNAGLRGSSACLVPIGTAELFVSFFRPTGTHRLSHENPSLERLGYLLRVIGTAPESRLAANRMTRGN
jgi:hypothetical protein